MRFATLFALTTPLLVVADLSLNSVHGGNHGVNKRHHANRDSALSQRDEAHITLHQNRKRFSGARATFYDVGTFLLLLWVFPLFPHLSGFFLLK